MFCSSTTLLYFWLQIFRQCSSRKYIASFSILLCSVSGLFCLDLLPLSTLNPNTPKSFVLTNDDARFSLSLCLSPSLPIPLFDNNAHRGLLLGLLFSTESRASCCTPSFHPQDFSLATMMDLAFATHLKVKLAINNYYSTFFFRTEFQKLKLPREMMLLTICLIKMTELIVEQKPLH